MVVDNLDPIQRGKAIFYNPKFFQHHLGPVPVKKYEHPQTPEHTRGEEEMERGLRRLSIIVRLQYWLLKLTTPPPLPSKIPHKRCYVYTKVGHWTWVIHNFKMRYKIKTYQVIVLWFSERHLAFYYSQSILKQEVIISASYQKETSHCFTD